MTLGGHDSQGENEGFAPPGPCRIAVPASSIFTDPATGASDTLDASVHLLAALGTVCFILGEFGSADFG